MTSPAVNLFAVLHSATAQTRGMLESFDDENQTLKNHVNFLAKEIANLKQNHAVASEATAREITKINNENAELKSTVEKLEQTVALLLSQVKELIDLKNALAALLQPARSPQIAKPVEQPAPEIVAIDQRIAQTPTCAIEKI